MAITERIREHYRLKWNDAARKRNASTDQWTGIQRWDTYRGWQDIAARAFPTTRHCEDSGKRIACKRYRLVCDGWTSRESYPTAAYAINMAKFRAQQYPQLWRKAASYNVAQTEGEGH
jgi:hypothetical protein